MRLVLGTSASQFESEVAYQNKVSSFEFEVPSLKFWVPETELNGWFTTNSNRKLETRNFLVGVECKEPSGKFFKLVLESSSLSDATKLCWRWPNG